MTQLPSQVWLGPGPLLTWGFRPFVPVEIGCPIHTHHPSELKPLSSGLWAQGQIPAGTWLLPLNVYWIS